MAATGILDRSKLEDALRGFNALFDQAFGAQTTNIEPLAMRVPSAGPDETYDWMGPLPMMREWIGDRRMDELRAYTQNIVNKRWANGLRVSADDIEDDRLNMVAPRVRALAEMAARHQEKLLMDLLVSGFTTTCYDGQYFFDTDHVDGNGSSQSNKGTSALAADGVAYNAAWQAMMSIQDENGEPIGVMPTHLVVGPKLRSIAMGLLEAETLSTGGTNTNFGTAQLIVSPRLVGTYDDYWFLIAGGGALKPLILQERKGVEFIAQDNPDSEGYFNRAEYRFGADWRGNVGFGLWQLAYGAVL